MSRLGLCTEWIRIILKNSLTRLPNRKFLNLSGNQGNANQHQVWLHLLLPTDRLDGSPDKWVWVWDAVGSRTSVCGHAWRVCTCFTPRQFMRDHEMDLKSTPGYFIKKHLFWPLNCFLNGSRPARWKTLPLSNLPSRDSLQPATTWTEKEILV